MGREQNREEQLREEQGSRWNELTYVRKLCFLVRSITKWRPGGIKISVIPVKGGNTMGKAQAHSLPSSLNCIMFLEEHEEESHQDTKWSPSKEAFLPPITSNPPSAILGCGLQ